MTKPISIKILETLENFLKMYEGKHIEVLISESIANGLDAKSDEIKINLSQNNLGYYIIFANNGNPMNKTEFENYHTISSSSKTKGDGIGFAGIGAKVFLGAWDKAEIITITGKNNTVFASKMFRDKRNIDYDSTLDGTPIREIIGNSNINHKYGTTYKVKIDQKNYEWLQDNIHQKLQFWFNDTLITKKLKLIVNGKEIKPFKPNGKKIIKKIQYKKKNITCHIWISKDTIDKEWRHIVYSVFGKRVKNELVSWAPQIKGEHDKRICCMADVSILAQDLLSTKENFEKCWRTGHIKKLVESAFQDELKNQGLIHKHEDMYMKSRTVYNELTKRIDKILQNPEFKFLNPFLNSTTNNRIVKKSNGDITINEITRKQSTGELVKNKNITNNKISNKNNESRHYEDKEGKEHGVNKTMKTSNTGIIPEDYPEDPREGWIDLGNQAIVYNTGHPFSKKCEKNLTLYDYNLARVVISTIIKSKNDQVEMDANDTMKYFEDFLHQVWF